MPSEAIPARCAVTIVNLGRGASRSSGPSPLEITLVEAMSLPLYWSIWVTEMISAAEPARKAILLYW